MVVVGSQCSGRFSIVLNNSHRFSMFLSACLLVLIGYQCSHRFSGVLSGSRRF